MIRNHDVRLNFENRIEMRWIKKKNSEKLDSFATNSIDRLNHLVTG